jgi:hypothetical protein
MGLPDRLWARALKLPRQGELTPNPWARRAELSSLYDGSAATWSKRRWHESPEPVPTPEVLVQFVYPLPILSGWRSFFARRDIAAPPGVGKPEDAASSRQLPLPRPNEIGTFARVML